MHFGINIFTYVIYDLKALIFDLIHVVTISSLSSLSVFTATCVPLNADKYTVPKPPLPSFLPSVKTDTGTKNGSAFGITIHIKYFKV